ncbi:MAG: antitermination protein NusG [Gammaproteobacteria bacterium]|nr:antitermination protein NusG [Gammaproteobacteria bacterium]
MLTKLFFTLLLIGGVALFYRAKRPPEVIQRKAELSHTETKTPTFSARFIAYSFLTVTLTLSSLLFYLNWADEQVRVQVFVINSETGESREYRAKQGEIAGRSFRTLDGRYIFLATVERLEIRQTPKNLTSPAP